MLKCVLKPLRAVVGAALRDFQVRSGEWQELKDNLALAKARQPQELGVSELPAPPPPTAIEKIRNKFQAMVKHYSPEKKVALLLSACKLVYGLMEDNTGETAPWQKTRPSLPGTAPHTLDFLSQDVPTAPMTSCPC